MPCYCRCKSLKHRTIRISRHSCFRNLVNWMFASDSQLLIYLTVVDFHFYAFSWDHYSIARCHWYSSYWDAAITRIISHCIRIFSEIVQDSRETLFLACCQFYTNLGLNLNIVWSIKVASFSDLMRLSGIKLFRWRMIKI